MRSIVITEYALVTSSIFTPGVVAGTPIAGIMLEIGVLLGTSIFSFTSGKTNISSVVATGGTEILGTVYAAGAEYLTSPSALYNELECDAILE